jgi:hypothetical protein
MAVHATVFPVLLDAPIFHDGSCGSLGDLLGSDDPLLDLAVDMHTVWAYLGE